MPVFEPIVPNPDLDVHPNPPGAWGSVAVVCCWKDARAQRRYWPHAAVVGPLRSFRGLDDLIRNLLHNPQIRTVIVAGKDQSPDMEVTKALSALWKGEAGVAERFLGADVLGPSWDVFVDVDLVDLASPAQAVWKELALVAYPGTPAVAAGGSGSPPRARVTLPPPPPKTGETGPHGDPGERVAGATLADVWPLALARVLAFGVDADTQYGPTKEILNLVSVIRDVPGSLADLPEDGTKHPVLGVSRSAAAAYHRQVTSALIEDERPYSYGSRLRGTGEAAAPDQIEAVEAMLAASPGTRAAFVTPWRPAEDAGKESGRPCLVGVTYRVQAGPSGAPGTLNLTAVFRSHDMAGGWPTNLLGLAMWQVDLAARLGLRVGTLTCLSQSAHVYAHGWDAARTVVKTHPERKREPAWDQRSSWHVEWVAPAAVERPIVVGETLDRPRLSGVLDCWEVTDEPAGEDMIVVLNRTTRERVRALRRDWREARGDYRGPQPEGNLRATALTPDGRDVLGVFEASTPQALRAKIEDSGLVTSVGAALWLGDEIRRFARGGEDGEGGA